MTLALTHSVALLGLEGHLVTVEVDIADGLPGYSLLGLPDAALTESRERVRSAIVNCGEVWPNRKVTVSLSPAWLPKSGSSFDLAICISVLSAHESIAKEKIEELLFLGELSLDGRIRSVRGVLPALMAAYKAGVRTAVVPAANFEEAQLMQAMTIIPMEHLKQVLRWLRTGEREVVQEIDLQWEQTDTRLDFADWSTWCRKNHDCRKNSHDHASVNYRSSARSYSSAFDCGHFDAALTIIATCTHGFPASHNDPNRDGWRWFACDQTWCLFTCALRSFIR